MNIIIVGNPSFLSERIFSIFTSDIPNITCIKNKGDYINTLRQCSPDIIFYEITNQELEWREALTLKNMLAPLASFVLIGVDSEDDALGYLKAGVDEYLTKGHYKRLPSTIYHVIEKKKLLNKVYKSEQSFRSMFFEDNPAPQLLIDPISRRFIALNKAGEKFYGWTNEEFCNLKVEDVNTLSVEQINKIMKNVSAKNLSNFVVPHRLKNGEIRYVEIFGSLINYNGHECLHAVVVDVTDKKYAEEKILRDKEKAEDLNKMKTNFMAAMSHELRNPLFGLLSNAEFLKDKLDGELKKEAFFLHQSGMRLLSTVEQMLRFSNANAVKIQRNEPIKIKEDDYIKENLSINILIVEDELINMLSIKKMLQKSFKTFTARDGRSAIEIAKQNKIDIFLMDINLKSDINGTEATQILRNIKEYEETPIVAMTAYAFPGEKERFLSSGFSHYISKPFDNAQLLELINEIIVVHFEQQDV